MTDSPVRLALAEQINNGVRRIRLERRGLASGDVVAVPFDYLPEEECQTWLDIADVVDEIMERESEELRSKLRSTRQSRNFWHAEASEASRALARRGG